MKLAHLCVFLLFIITSGVFAEQPTTLIHNARIYTFSEPAVADSIVFDARGKIIAVGSHEKISARFTDTNSIDAQGATIIPGLIDAHGHILNLGLSLLRADLRGTQSKSEVLDRLKSFAVNLPKDSWLLGRGWDQNDWPERAFPNKADLDRAFPDRPVWLVRIDGHAAWANSAAIAASDRNLKGSWHPEGGHIERDDQQQATGVFVDRAMELIQRAVPETSDEELDEALRRAMDKLAEVGITGVHEAGTSLSLFRRYQKLRQKDQLKIRIYAMANGAGDLFEYLCENGSIIDPYLTARSIKLYADGALGSRGAALLNDYSDDPGNRGLLIVSEASLGKVVDQAMSCGLQVNTHAIGDRGNKVVLDLYQQAIAKYPQHIGRHRVEHAQVVALSDFERFKKMGLIASVQPTHATSDMYWAEDRVGADRIRGAYAWQRFLKLGVPLALGSDFPVEEADPLLGIYASISRQDQKKWPTDGWYADQALSPKQAIHGFTLGAAYAAFQEDQLGSLAVGKFADLTILSADPMQIDPSEILEIKVLATFVNGQQTYRHKNW